MRSEWLKHTAALTSGRNWRSPNSNGAMPVGSESNWVDVTARVQTGSPYVVGRINFSGHYRVNESTLRRAMILQERALFDVGQLRRSLARLNGSGLFEPITPDDVETREPGCPCRPTSRYRCASGLAGIGRCPVLLPSTGFVGSLQAAISSRLPPWGRGVFEASTYYVTFSLIGLPNPLVRLLPFVLNRACRPCWSWSARFSQGRPCSPASHFHRSAPSGRCSQVTASHILVAERARHWVATRRRRWPLLVPVQTSHAAVDGERSSCRVPHLRAAGSAPSMAAPRRRVCGGSGAWRVTTFLVACAAGSIVSARFTVAAPHPSSSPP